MRHAAVALTALALLAGCGGARQATTTTAPPRSAAVERWLEDQLAHRTAPVVPGGYRVRRSTEGGFAVAFPAGWQVLQHRDAVWPGAIPTLVRVNRGLAPYLTALVFPDSPLKLVGFDRRFTAGFATTATVIVSTNGFGRAYAAWSVGVLRSVRKLAGVRGLSSRHLVLPAGDALLARYQQRTGKRRLATLQLFVPRDGRMYVLTLATLPSLVARYEPTFLRVAGSLDLSVEILHP